MSTGDQCCNGSGVLRVHPLRRAWQAVCLWVYLKIWCRRFYRPTMRLLHKFNLHYAPPSPMSPRYGKQEHWCQWCGLRGTRWTHDPKAPLGIVEP
jgi:hypothetical protein